MREIKKTVYKVVVTSPGARSFVVSRSFYSKDRARRERRAIARLRPTNVHERMLRLKVVERKITISVPDDPNTDVMRVVVPLPEAKPPEQNTESAS